MDQPQAYICTFPLQPPSCLPPLQVVTQQRFEFPESYSKFPLAMFYICQCICFHATLPIHPTLSFLTPYPVMSVSLVWSVSVFHTAWCPVVHPCFDTSAFPSSLRLKNIPLCVCVDHALFIRSSVDGHLGYFHPSAVVNKMLLQTWVFKYVFKLLLSLLWEYTQNWDCCITDSYHFFIFITNLILFSDSLSTGYMDMPAQSCPTLCDLMDCNPPDSSVHGISQAGKLEWVVISFSTGSSRLGDQTLISYVFCIAGRFFTTSATWEDKTAWWSLKILHDYHMIQQFPF